MDDFVACTSRRRVALLLLISIVFALLGMWMAGWFGPVPTSRRAGPEMTLFWGWITIAFSGTCGAVASKMWWDNGEQLRIGKQGIRWLRWCEQTIPWNEITDVTEWQYKGTRSIILHVRDASLFPGKGIVGLAGKANRALTGGDIGISLDGTDRSFDEAMAAISKFRSAF